MGVVNPVEMPKVKGREEAIEGALRKPTSSNRLSDLVESKDHVAIVATDLTRVCPDDLIIPVILSELKRAKVPYDHVTVIIGLGLHRPMDEKEIEEKFGRVCRLVRVVNHSLEGARLVDLGYTSQGAPITMNRLVVEADKVVSTGVVEPHLYAGYSGGSKTVGIGCAGERTIKYTHGPKVIDHEGVRLGSIKGNIFHEMVTEIASNAGLDFIVNLVLDGNAQIIGSFAGHPVGAFRQAVNLADKSYKVKIPRQADIVISGVGWPNDTNLYQATRAATHVTFAPKPAVKKGGVIITPAPLDEGIGKGLGDGRFFELLSSKDSVDDLVNEIRAKGYPAGGQRAYMVAKALRWADFIIVGSKIPEEVQRAHLKTARNIHEALEFALKKCGTDAEVMVMPRTLLTIPVLE